MKQLIAFVFACAMFASCTTSTLSAENQTADSTATVAAPADSTVAAACCDTVAADSTK